MGRILFGEGHIISGLGENLLRLFHVTESFWISFSAGSKVAHEEPCVVVLGLGVDGDYLGTGLQRIDRIIIGTCDFSAYWVDSKEGAFRIALTLRQGHFFESFIGDRYALVAEGRWVRKSLVVFKQSRYSCHLILDSLTVNSGEVLHKL